MALGVAIVGPGALGHSLGALLERGGAKLLSIGRGGPENAGPPKIDVALVTTKAYDTKAAIAGAAWCFPGAPVISLQNGLGNVEAIAEALGAPELVFGGSTTHAARRHADGRVEHVAPGETRIAPLRPEQAEAGRALAAKLAACGLGVEVEADLPRLLWRKLAVVCGILAVTATRGLSNGELLRSPEDLRTAVEAADEALAVARGLGIDVGPESGLERVGAVLARTAENRSSMLQDVELGRRTEVDEINGAVVRIARKKLKREAPHNAALAAAVRALAPQGSGSAARVVSPEGIISIRLESRPRNA